MPEILYDLTYDPDGAGCPHHIAQQANVEEWEWNHYHPEPFSFQITQSYSAVITDREIRHLDFDLYGSHSLYASQAFLDLCDACGVRYRAIPYDFTFRDKSRPAKRYFVFLSAEHLPLLDTERSRAEVEKVLETGETMMNRHHPGVPMYAKIDGFIPREIATPHLFMCVDLFTLVCTGHFREQALARKLRGLKFTPLDERYCHDPWAGW